MNADGSGKRKITPAPPTKCSPPGTRRGSMIAFATDLNGNYDIYGISVDDEKTFPIVRGPDQRDPSRVVTRRHQARVHALADRGPEQDATLWVANADGSVPTELAILPPAVHPAWAPDGRRWPSSARMRATGTSGRRASEDSVVKEGRLRLARRCEDRRPRHDQAARRRDDLRHRGYGRASGCKRPTGGSSCRASSSPRSSSPTSRREPPRRCSPMATR